MVRVRSVERIARDQPLDCPSIPPLLGGADKRTAGSLLDLFMSRLVGRLLAIGQAIAQLWNEPSAAQSLRGSNEVSSPLIVIFACFFIINKTSMYMQFEDMDRRWAGALCPRDWSILRNGFVRLRRYSRQVSAWVRHVDWPLNVKLDTLLPC